MSDPTEALDFPPCKKPKFDTPPCQFEEGMGSTDAIAEIDFTEDVTEHTKHFEISDDKCNNYVTDKELEKLKEFKVIDEVKSNDEDSDAEGSDSNSDAKSEGLPDDEIEKMLEEDLPDDFKVTPKPKEKTYVKIQKTVLEEKGINQFEVLPLDWVCVPHCSGAQVYMHRATRVCTLAKPYFIGKLNTRRHEIPLSAIPCLAYRRALEKEEKQKIIDKSIQDQIKAYEINKEAQKAAKENNVANNDNLVSIDEDCNRNTIDNTEDNENMDVTVTEDKIENGSSEKINNHDSIASSENLLKERINENKSQTELAKCPLANGSSLTDAQESHNNVIINNSDNNIESAKNTSMPSKEPLVLPGGIIMPPPRVEKVNIQHLTHDEVTEYCKKLFKFKTVNVIHFKRWVDRRKYAKIRKTLQNPPLPEGTKHITIPAHNINGQENGGKGAKHDWVMNMNDSSYLSVFHEYVRRALEKQPVYEFKQLENASSPYQATVYIGGMQYGVGRGSSKRQAKSAAARASIRILIPDMKDELDAAQGHPPAANTHDDPDFTFFDNIGIEDPRVSEFCAAACEPSPHAVLRTCLLRNFGAGDRHIHTEIKKLEYQKIELMMKVGKHTATVICKNKKLAKQRASQAILQSLHPHVHCWGSLLRLYGSKSVKSCKEKKLEEQQITLLQDKARHNEPNYAVLEKLRNEMRKLKERDESVVAIGTLLVSDQLPTHSGSNLNNVDF